MALPSSGAISLNDVATEFGGSTPHSLNEYYGVDTGVPSSGTISLSDFYGTSSGVVDNALQSVFNFSAAGNSHQVVNVTSRAGCFGRDTNNNYENYVWIVTGDDLRKYTRSGNSWTLSLTKDSPLSTNILGCADNGTHVLLCDASGNAALYNKANNSFGSSRSIGGGNTQGISWDGQQWIVTSYGNANRVYRVNSNNTSTLGNSYILNSARKRGNAYDFLAHRHWVFGDGNSDQTFGAWVINGFGTVKTWPQYDSNATTSNANTTTADEGDIFITSDGKKFLCQFDNGTIRVRARLTDHGTNPVGGGGGSSNSQSAFVTWAQNNGWSLVVPQCTGNVWGDPYSMVTDDSRASKFVYMSIQSSALSAIISAGNSVGYKTTAIGSRTGYSSVTRNSCTSNSWQTWDAMRVQVAYYDINQDKYIQKNNFSTFSEFTGP